MSDEVKIGARAARRETAALINCVVTAEKYR